MTTERTDLITSVLATRDTIDPELDTELLEAIVDAEANHPDNADEAISAIEAAVNNAIERGVGDLPADATTDGSEREEEDES